MEKEKVPVILHEYSWTVIHEYSWTVMLKAYLFKTCFPVLNFIQSWDTFLTQVYILHDVV